MKISPFSFFGPLRYFFVAVLRSKFYRYAAFLVCIIVISQGFTYKKNSESSHLAVNEIATTLLLPEDAEGLPMI